MKKLVLALGLILGLSAPAMAQNTTCATRPAGDSSNACASTKFVQNTIGGAFITGVAPITASYSGGIWSIGLNVGTGLGVAGGNLNLQPASAATIGGVNSITSASHNWIAYIDTAGLPHQSQPGFSDLSGNIAVSQMNSGTGASSTTYWRGDGTWASIISSSPSYDTKSAAVAATIPGTVNEIHLNGYTTVGDSSSDWKRVVSPTSTTGTCSATCVQPWFQSADGAYWQLANQFVYPELFGAAADGTTDDSNAIQSWINYCGASLGGRCQLNGKTYYTNTTINISGKGSSILENDANYSIFGVGPQSVISCGSGANPCLSVESVNATGNFTFADMQIYSSTSTVTLMHTKYVINHMNFERVVFNGGGIGLYLDSEATNNGSLTIHGIGSTFYNNATGGILMSPQATNLVENVHLDGFEFIVQPGYGIYITGADAIWIHDCRFERVTLSSTSAPIHVDTSQHINIYDNYIEDGNNLPLIEVGTSVVGINVHHNYLSEAVNGGTNAAATAIKINGTTYGIEFSHNRVVINGNVGAVFDSSGQTIANLDRHDNIMAVNGGFTVTKGFNDGTTTNFASYSNIFGGAGTWTATAGVNEGVACSGTPTASFASSNGIVNHC